MFLAIVFISVWNIGVGLDYSVNKHTNIEDNMTEQPRKMIFLFIDENPMKYIHRNRDDKRYWR